MRIFYFFLLHEFWYLIINRLIDKVCQQNKGGISWFLNIYYFTYNFKEFIFILLFSINSNFSIFIYCFLFLLHKHIVIMVLNLNTLRYITPHLVIEILIKNLSYLVNCIFSYLKNSIFNNRLINNIALIYKFSSYFIIFTLM